LISQQYLAYRQARRAKAEAGLKQILAANEAPPPSITEATARLGERTQYLYKRFPELCRLVTQRHYSYRPSPKARAGLKDHQQIHHQFAAIIAREEKPPPSIREVARRLECGYTTLRRRHSDLCDQLLDQAQAYQEAQISGLPARLNQMLTQNELPAPSLREVASRLGVQAYVLKKACPDMCAEILRRAQAERQAAKQRRKAFLDQVLARSNGPAPALPQVAKILNTTDVGLQEQFPEESALIVQRYQTYKAAEKQAWQDALQAALTADQTPPPTLAEVAQQLGHGHSMKLRFHFPHLCQQLQHRRQAYLADRRHELQAQLEAMLAESQAAPPPTLMQAARRLGCDESTLKHFFPTQVQALMARRQHHDEVKKLAAERALQAILEDEQGAPPALKALARELGYTYDTLRAYFPDLAAAVVARRQAFVKARSQQRRYQLAEEVKRITRELYQQGINPSAHQLRLRLPKPGVLVDPYVLEAWREARAELGLPT
jgi:AraC-like DNA-binding protein